MLYLDPVILVNDEVTDKFVSKKTETGLEEVGQLSPGHHSRRPERLVLTIFAAGVV
jgi:hypothetical protein